jgi:hypothetical protein
MDTTVWQAVVEDCCSLIHEASGLLACLTRPIGQAPAEPCLGRAPALIEAVLTLQQRLATLTELNGHQRALNQLHRMLLDWQASAQAGSPLERRYQAAVMQQAILGLSAALKVQAHARIEIERAEHGLQGPAAAGPRPTRPT